MAIPDSLIRGLGGACRVRWCYEGYQMLRPVGFCASKAKDMEGTNKRIMQCAPEYTAKKVLILSISNVLHRHDSSIDVVKLA